MVLEKVGKLDEELDEVELCARLIRLILLDELELDEVEALDELEELCGRILLLDAIEATSELDELEKVRDKLNGRSKFSPL